ncbi:1-acyl-sn-glycerol-3-phosphate acyltransferase [Amphritea pacifica]|uniref:1-acyl-sn-glycerol-3-phosphate acyltransferase n=1 Tax=Amphritea pacifica TaxID=2811233 RepID=A0ABS2WBU1_9GAMM|nr:1-acyl-sn-glycerol-3-phosphate acyltransferase [Amphritea pacifica]MBN0989076.1 1-acyl-sn-glycerol-3-phosphate acyltransferase [Amphritea pacifica]MBN1008006.1 1-acyl-sn-glycerol-3-phosphate acyltransferase [Amphritea pacifica]
MAASSINDPFQNIRPYHDSEVSDVLNRLIHDDELISVLTRYQFPQMASLFGWLLKPAVRIYLAQKTGEIESIQDFQLLIAGYMTKMIGRTTSRLSCSGIENLEQDEAYLFVSNHRDIAMDPAFVNWALYQNGFDTLRIAIGDNLLRKPYVSDLMRLNKSFIVNRSAKGREVLTALGQLSAYIDHSLVQDEASVWIAQREGRAKDGNDFTDPAILKMFYMAHRKQRSFAEFLERVKIVPVSISYEYDPCDRAKAQELDCKSQGGEYQKAQFEDIDSIVTGITGNKGHVHVAFGDVITDKNTPEELATEIDRQIIDNYYLHPSNLLAAGVDQDSISDEQKTLFAARTEGLSESAAKILRQMYANPVLNKQKPQEVA